VLENEEAENKAADTLKKLESVTKELPKIVMNENGEYVEAEPEKESF
jgi:hypothetical protein